MHSGGIYTVIPSVIIILLAHSFSSGVLFAFAGMLSSRYHTRDICEMRGLFKSAPRFTLHFLIISFLSGALPIGLTFSSELVFFSQLIRGAYTLLIVFYLLGLFIVFIKLLITFVDISSGEKPRSVIIVDLTRSEFLLSTVFICILGILFIYSSYLFSFIALSIKSAVINKKISDIHFANVFDIKK